MQLDSGWELAGVILKKERGMGRLQPMYNYKCYKKRDQFKQARV